ncbi:MAG: hypothetical protein IPK74_00275 [Deltaproteobacteria bacterium]|nr:hypothetical protein [Deltaproteobacteria bacterium]
MACGGATARVDGDTSSGGGDTTVAVEGSSSAATTGGGDSSGSPASDSTRGDDGGVPPMDVGVAPPAAVWHVEQPADSAHPGWSRPRASACSGSGSTP